MGYEPCRDDAADAVHEPSPSSTPTTSTAPKPTRPSATTFRSSVTAKPLPHGRIRSEPTFRQRHRIARRLRRGCRRQPDRRWSSVRRSSACPTAESFPRRRRRRGVAEDTPVSMNLFGFTTPDFRLFEGVFQDVARREPREPQIEFYIPTMVNKLIGEGAASCACSVRRPSGTASPTRRTNPR